MNKHPTDPAQLSRWPSGVWPFQGDARLSIVGCRFDGQAADPLAERAARNYPESQFLQAAWLKAVGIVRATKRGWVLDDAARQKGSHA